MIEIIDGFSNCCPGLEVWLGDITTFNEDLLAEAFSRFQRLKIIHMYKMKGDMAEIVLKFAKRCLKLEEVVIGEFSFWEEYVVSPLEHKDRDGVVLHIARDGVVPR